MPNNYPVICGIATMDGRQECLIDALESLSGQCDSIYVYPNDYDPAEYGLFSRLGSMGIGNVYWYDNPDRPDMGDTAMMNYFFYHYSALESGRTSANFMTAGDDLIYPPDYVETLNAAIERHGRRAAVGFHGRLYFSPVESYYRSMAEEAAGGRARIFPCLYACLDDEQYVTQLSTCAAMWPSELLELHPEDFPVKNMTDIWFSKKLNDLGIPRILVPHEGGWIVHTDKINMQETICALAWFNDEVQTRVFNETEWRL